MEQIKQIIDDVERDLKKEVKIESVTKMQAQLASFNSLFNQIMDKTREASAVIAEQDLDKFKDLFKAITNEITEINKKFANFIEITKQMQTEEAIKTFLIQKLNEIFNNMDDAASRNFNLSTLEIYDEFTKELKSEMETSLIARIQQELFSIKDGLGQFQKTYEMADKQFDLIQKGIMGIQLKFQEKFDSIKAGTEVFPKLLASLTNDFEAMPEAVKSLQNEVGNVIAAIRDAPLQMIQKLRSELQSHQAEIVTQLTKLSAEKKEILDEKQGLESDLEEASKKVQTLDKETKMSAEQIARMKEEHAAMKAELEQLSGQLEKVTDEFQTLSQDKERRMERTEVLALLMTLLVEVFGAQPHSKILFLLHGQKETWDRTSLIKASGIGGAMVRKALQDLSAAKLVEYDIEKESIKLLKHIY